MNRANDRVPVLPSSEADMAGAARVEHVRRMASLDSGLICGYSFAKGTPTEPVRAADLPRALQERGRTVWLHFNVSDAAARRWLEQSDLYPLRAMRAVLERETRCRLEPERDGILLVLNDLTYEDNSDPEEVATVWAYATEQRLVTARAHPLKSLDRLRSAAREGEVERSGFALLARLLEIQIEALGTLADSAAEELNHVEDLILSGRISAQRSRLGKVRRLVAHLRRHFAPQRLAMMRGLQRIPPAVPPEDVERLRNAGDGLSSLIESAAGLHDRAKLLQEELASRIAEETNRNLYVLTIFSAIVMPMNLIAGVFGMNVAGLPGTEDPASFLWAMLLIIVSGVGTLLALKVKRLL